MNEGKNVAVLAARELQAIAKEVECRLAEVTGEKVLFSLFLWTNSRGDYVANCERESMMVAMQEFIEAWENGEPEQPPSHEVH